MNWAGTILDRYIARRLFTISVFALVLFTIAWLAPETLFNAVQGVADKLLTPMQGLYFLLLKIPGVLSYCIPIAALFSSVFLFRQLSLSSELVAILAGGISLRRLMIPVSIVGLFLMAMFVVNQEVFQPIALIRLKVLSEQTGFMKKDKERPYVTFLEKGDKGQLEKFLVVLPDAQDGQSAFICLFFKTLSTYSTGQEGLVRSAYIDQILTADKARWNSQFQSWQLQDGWRYELAPDGIYQESVPFASTMVATSPIAAKLIQFPFTKAAEMNVLQLSQYVHLLEDGGQSDDARFFDMKWAQRFTLPWVIVIFTLFGCTIGIERSRAKKNLGLTYTALLLLLYNVVVSITTTMGNVGVLPVWMSSALPIVFAVGSGWGVSYLRKIEG